MKRMRALLGIFVTFLVMFMMATAPALGAGAGFGNLYYEGMVVRTVVPPAAMPMEGRDNFYVVDMGAEGQLGVAAVAPGDQGYHGGKWAFHLVEWNVSPYLLISEDEVLTAAMDGDVTITRMPEKDFKCPIQP